MTKRSLTTPVVGIICLFSCCSSMASLIDLLETVVDDELASQIGFEVHVFDDDLARSGYLDIYVAIPASYRESALRSVTLEMGRDGKRLVDSHLQIHEFEDHRGLTDFSGINLRFYDQSLDSLRLQISYGRGEITTDLLAFPILEFLPERRACLQAQGEC